MSSRRAGGASGGEHVRFGGRGLTPIDERRLDELLRNGSAPEPEERTPMRKER